MAPDDRPPIDFDLNFGTHDGDDEPDPSRVLDLDAELVAPPSPAPAPFGVLEVDIGGQRHEVALDKPRLLIGRIDPATGQAPDVNLSDDAAVSRRHAEIRLRDGALRVVDLGSTNGTKLNGRTVAAGEELPLANGDVIAVGERCRLTVRLR